MNSDIAQLPRVALIITEAIFARHKLIHLITYSGKFYLFLLFIYAIIPSLAKSRLGVINHE